MKAKKIMIGVLAGVLFSGLGFTFSNTTVEAYVQNGCWNGDSNYRCVRYGDETNDYIDASSMVKNGWRERTVIIDTVNNATDEIVGQRTIKIYTTNGKNTLYQWSTGESGRVYGHDSEESLINSLTKDAMD